MNTDGRDVAKSDGLESHVLLRSIRFHPASTDFTRPSRVFLFGASLLR